MSKLDLSPKKEQIVWGNDNIVIQNYVSGVPGGRTLKLNFGEQGGALNYPLSAVYAGHVIVRMVDENDEVVYLPLPIALDPDTNEYVYVTQFMGSLGADDYVGVLTTTIPASNPQASIMTSGQVNAGALPYIASLSNGAFDLREVLPNIVFNVTDEIA